MKAKIDFKNFVVPKFQFDKNLPNDVENTLELMPQVVISRSKKQFHINVELELIDKENDFLLQMICVGIFHYNIDDENELLNFMSINGPAIIFPYIRSFISSFTALSGFDTVTLPTLNLSGFKQELIENLIDLDEMSNE